jgi:hypothetical protein
MDAPATVIAPRRGRPRKFAGPSRALTLTLPEDVIEVLVGLDSDPSRAVVRLAQSKLARRRHPPAELTTFGRRAVIVVSPSRTLEQRTGVNLIQLPDGRALISFDQAMSIPTLELLVEDAVADRSLSRADQMIFEAIASILRSARRSNDVSLIQRNIIVVESHRRASARRRRPVVAARSK